MTVNLNNDNNRNYSNFFFIYSKSNTVSITGSDNIDRDRTNNTTSRVSSSSIFLDRDRGN